MIFCLVYFTLTFVIPAKATYRILASEHKQTEPTALWSVYWAFFALVTLLQHSLPFLQIKPLEIIIMLFLLWLYNDTYRGALYLKELLEGFFEGSELVRNVVTVLKSMNLLLKIFDDEEKSKSE